MIPVIIEAINKARDGKRLFQFLFPGMGKRKKSEKGEIELVNNETPILKIKTSENVKVIQIKD